MDTVQVNRFMHTCGWRVIRRALRDCCGDGDSLNPGLERGTQGGTVFPSLGGRWREWGQK